jgi:hypothetical protein
MQKTLSSPDCQIKKGEVCKIKCLVLYVVVDNFVTPQPRESSQLVKTNVVVDGSIAPCFWILLEIMLIAVVIVS